jgi:hypothetical protein
MNRTVLIALALATARTATAQPDPAPAPAPDPVPAPEPPPPPAPEPVVEPTVMPAPSAPDARRPDGFSIAIGLGWDLPADLQAPNTTSARFRLASGLTFEPSVTLGRSTASMTTGMTETESKDLELTIATIARWPVHGHGRVDFELLGGAGLSIVSDFPDGADNDIRTTTISASWGLGLGFWITRHWQVSLSALNPILAYTKRTVQTGPDTENESSSTTIAATFDPNVILMAHLYW